MKAIVLVEPNIVPGIRRGGEDLYIDFTCTVQGTEMPTEFTIDFVTDDIDGCSCKLIDDAGNECDPQNNPQHEDGLLSGIIKYT